MNLETALKTIKSSFNEMNSRYGKVVFDEWFVLSLNTGREDVFAYSGPRRDDFRVNFPQDLKALRMELHRAKHNVGDFDFARNATGTHFDAFIVVGVELFLVCNSTNLSMQEITQNPNWLNAQVIFVELTDKFRANPLEAA